MAKLLRKVINICLFRKQYSQNIIRVGNGVSFKENEQSSGSQFSTLAAFGCFVSSGLLMYAKFRQRSLLAAGGDDTGRKWCYCIRCNGKEVSKKTHYLHKKEFIKGILPSNTEVKRDLDQEMLHHGTGITTLQAVCREFSEFCADDRMTKKALDMKFMRLKTILPQPNHLPGNYRCAVSLVESHLIPLKNVDVCINDCHVYNGQYSEHRDCPTCREPRYNANRKARKVFTYMQIGPRLSRWYGNSNLAQLVHARKININSELMSDFFDGKVAQEWFGIDGCFDNYEYGAIPFALFTDGLNPNRNIRIQKSMWPIILTWLTLPSDLRTHLGPMFLYGIVPGLGGCEPKTLDPYIELLVDELLSLTDTNLYDAYVKAPVAIKARILHYQCDIPAFAKLLHLPGQASLKCMFCGIEGQYCKELSKSLHVHARDYLPNNHLLRKANQEFLVKDEIINHTPTLMSKATELDLRNSHDMLPNENRKKIFAKENGVKGWHPLLKQPEFERAKQMSPDGMHTPVDVCDNILKVLLAHGDQEKIISSENKSNRFQTFLKDNEHTHTDEHHKRKKKKVQLPWVITKQDAIESDKICQNLIIPRHYGITPGNYFTKPFTLSTMDCKKQFFGENILPWCVKGKIGSEQQTTLETWCKAVSDLWRREFKKSELQTIKEHAHVALSLLERDFPLTLQNITTHAISHVAEDIERFGPLQSRWLFPLERCIGWLTRQTTNKFHQESTIMNTYRLYDWCSYMILSGRMDNCEVPSFILNHFIATENTDIKTAKTIIQLDNHQAEIMKQFYKCDETDLKMITQVKRKQVVRNQKKFTINPTTSFVCVLPYPFHKFKTVEKADVLFGKIHQIYQHHFKEEMHDWVNITVFDNTQLNYPFWTTSKNKRFSVFVPLQYISEPLIVAEEENSYNYLNLKLNILDNDWVSENHLLKEV